MSDATTIPTTAHGHAAPAPPAAVYGLVAEFHEPHHVVTAARRAYRAGYRQMEAYSPMPVAGLAEAIGFRKNRVALAVLVGGVTGALTGITMQWFSAAVHYPIIIGGRPFASWPSFIPVTFELAILLSAFAAVFGMLAMNGLPRPHHPIFNAPGFARASQDRFFLCVEATDPKFDLDQTRQFLRGLGARDVAVVADE